MKYLVLFVFFISTFTTFSQIGISNINPQASLDVTGEPTVTTAVDGIIAPRLTLAQLTAKTGYNTAQTGALVYVTDVVGTINVATAAVNTIGYYYFNGTTWQALAIKSIAPIFIASLGNGNGSVTATSIPATAFRTVPLPNVIKNLGGGAWDSTNNTYAIPVSGTYLIKSTVRLVDGSAGRNIFQAVNTTNVDIPDGLWQTNSGSRWTFLYTRIANFNVGDRLRLYIYSDGSVANLSDASLNITLINLN